MDKTHKQFKLLKLLKPLKPLRLLFFSILVTATVPSSVSAERVKSLPSRQESVALSDFPAVPETDTDGSVPGPDTPYILRGNTSTVIDLSQMSVSTDNVEAKASAFPVYEWFLRGVRPKAAVILVHGLFQHGESLAPMARHLAQNGFLAISIDQRGHGYWHFKNAAGKPGYSIDYEKSIEDITSLTHLLREEHPTLPVFCIGESAGAAIVARAAAASPGLYDGIILCAFSTKPRNLHVLWTVEDVATHFLDWNHDIKMTRYVKRFSSEDSRVVAENIDDPMCRRGISLRELIDTCKFMKRTEKVAKMLSPNLPLMVLEGENDKVLDPKSAEKFMANSRCQFKKFVLVPDCGHVLVTTNFIKPLVLSSIDEWLEQHAPGQFSTSAIVAKK